MPTVALDMTQDFPSAGRFVAVPMPQEADRLSASLHLAFGCGEGSTDDWNRLLRLLDDSANDLVRH